jgi:hypothetical protein
VGGVGVGLTGGALEGTGLATGFDCTTGLACFLASTAFFKRCSSRTRARERERERERISSLKDQH